MPRQAARARARKSSRGPLTRAQVVDAAVRMADAQGLDAVTMRSLAKALGIEAMSLYSHVPNKEVLLGLMAAHVIDQVPTPSSRLPPRTRLCQLAHEMRAVALAHPHVFPLVVLKPLELSESVRPTEIALQAFVDAGLEDRRAIRSQRVFLSFVRGYLLWELGGFAAGRGRDADGGPTQKTVADVAALDARQFPQAKRLAKVFFSILPELAYADGLDWVLDSLLPQSSKRRSTVQRSGGTRSAGTRSAGARS